MTAIAIDGVIQIVTMAGTERIVINPEVCGGRSIIAGTRTRVVDVLEMLAGGTEEAEILADFPFGRPRIFAPASPIRHARSTIASCFPPDAIFLVDAQLPEALCDWLVEQGHEADYIGSLLPGEMPDRVIADFAAEHEYVLGGAERHDFGMHLNFTLLDELRILRTLNFGLNSCLLQYCICGVARHDFPIDDDGPRCMGTVPDLMIPLARAQPRASVVAKQLLDEISVALNHRSGSDSEITLVMCNDANAVRTVKPRWVSDKRGIEFQQVGQHASDLLGQGFQIFRVGGDPGNVRIGNKPDARFRIIFGTN